VRVSSPPLCGINFERVAQTTFFVATEAQLLSGTVGGGGNPSKLGEAANAGLTGALVIHSFAGTYLRPTPGVLFLGRLTTYSNHLIPRSLLPDQPHAPGSQTRA
jgi:hypothetical protein